MKALPEKKMQSRATSTHSLPTPLLLAHPSPRSPKPLPAATNLQTWGCTEFANRPEGVTWDPYALTLDPSRELVYVGDYFSSVIFAFSYDGTFHGRVGTTKGFLFNPTSIAIKPAKRRLLFIQQLLGKSVKRRGWKG